MQQHRLLSYSEVQTALDCQAKHDFRYGDQLAGSSLRPKRLAPLLSAGRAWGAAVAAFHVSGDGTPAVQAMDAALNADAERQREFGVHDQDAHDELRMHLLRLLAHYTDTAESFSIEPLLERELVVPVPARSGKRASTRYRFLCYLDGYREVNGRTWLVEFKLRGSLSSVEQIALSRQLRWYAWAFWQATGEKPAGFDVVERLNVAPKPPRVLKSGKPSHAKDQQVTADAYEAVCHEFNEEPHADTLAELRRRRWQQRVPIVFREGELEEAGRDLVSAGRLIGLLDRGELYPLRNAGRKNCYGCDFREICTSPDNDLVEALYERVPAKRNRQEEATR